ncbi:hypothetical protein FA09DRAFT_328281 [Tilletiopsis washingtonensis]|uniref:Citrate transporter-like domain-containing protein n=1 Tax=Tilletiopsis washingtonensis TaxID=58919 RepID=A0A316ZEI5_9BASI|nr:hypothetical protein FA09DRAFT_328281 [Tilletiopsis washingtonensis]PWO00178.1 hypothetical protein FA09DRAFT_328281 [Tilletiopsis washingtonensis]
MDALGKRQAADAAQQPVIHPLNGHGIFAIIVFAIVSLVCIQPVRVPIPHAVSTPVRNAWQRAVGRDAAAQQEPLAPELAPELRRASQEAVPPTPGTMRSEEELAKADSLPARQPKPQRAYLVFDHVWTPAVGILFLLATHTIGGEQLRAGIVGEEGVEPYDVLALFISLAYIAISLDATGLLRYLAFQVCLKAGSSGMRLFLLLYAFFFTAGVLVGNDPVILSGTAFLVYFTRVAGISPPSAWIWGQFVAANISSAVLVSSNPTNLVIATGFGISFPTYTAYMILPSVASALAAILTMLLFFRNQPAKEVPVAAGRSSANPANVLASARSLMSKASLKQRGHASGDAASASDAAEPEPPSTPPAVERQPPLIYIPKTIIRPDVDPRAALVDRNGAIFGTFVMLATLGVLVGTSVTGHVKVYQIAVPGAVITFLRDAGRDWYMWRALKKEKAASRSDAVQSEAGNGEPGIEMTAPGTAPSATPAPARRPFLGRVLQRPHAFATVFPTVTVVLRRLPFPLLPFAFGMFILVQGLGHVGFIDIMARGLGRVCASGTTATAFFISTLGIVLCNFGGTNIGSTILLTKALQSRAFTSQLPLDQAAIILKTGTYSIAFGSNVGALGGTFAASLAGLLWRQGLAQGGVHVTPGQFALWCAVVIVPSTVAGIGVLLAEVTHFRIGE